uniref:Secreted protein n=1 Tax=Anopheles darlingi TaxID=43151 RepID=A0A2M4DED1_ANODA
MLVVLLMLAPHRNRCVPVCCISVPDRGHSRTRTVSCGHSVARLVRLLVSTGLLLPLVTMVLVASVQTDDTSGSAAVTFAGSSTTTADDGARPIRTTVDCILPSAVAIIIISGICIGCS